MIGPKQIFITIQINKRKYTFKVRVEAVNENYECYKVVGRKSKIIILSNRPALRKNKALRKRPPAFYLIDGEWTGARDYYEEMGFEVAKILDTLPPDEIIKLPVWAQGD